MLRYNSKKVFRSCVTVPFASTNTICLLVLYTHPATTKFYWDITNLNSKGGNIAMEEKYRGNDLTPAPAGVEVTEPDEGRAARSASEIRQSLSEEPLSPASRLALERFVEKWKPYIDDPLLLDPPMRMLAQIIKQIAKEEGVIGE
jgi:hypothetical protein